ncbi:MAG TPA: TadE family protein [Anaerolineae bacterium]|nr:TadE family protein [Anaerolineae bacterium]
MKKMHREGRLDRQRGQGLLEFALVIAFLFLVIFAIIDFSRVFFGYATMSNGVREGARYAIVHPEDDAAIEAAARSMMVVIGAPVNIQIIFPDKNANKTDCRSHLCRVQVVATSDFPVWTPIFPNITMVARATMHIE